jgi:4-hydroxy-tetrahydrodipicolinate synthase
MSRDVIDRLRHGLVPAAPVPFVNGQIDEDSQERYATWMSKQTIAGVAVWAHTGRGLYLSQSQREQALSSWRKALPGKLVIAGAGGSRDAQDDASYISSAKEMAVHAKSLAADALLCYAPARFRDRADSERDRLVLEHHQALATAGLPMILFCLYEAAGGISYSPEVLTKLLQMDQVIGIKIATLDSIMMYQDISALCKSVAPDKLVITGEDRFLGYSLMCGADAALIGMGAAYTELQSRFLSSFYSNDFTTFHSLNARIDALAQATFIKPMEGYIARTSYILSSQGIFGKDSWLDPWGPKIEQSELDAIGNAMKMLDQ